MDDKEVMKPIPGYDGYFATESGDIWTCRRGLKYLKRMKSRPHFRSGYIHIDLVVGKKCKTVSVHTLVLLTFVGPKPDGYETRHKNGIKTDNRLENLCWGTPQENTNDKHIHGTIIKRPLPLRRFTVDQVRHIRERLALGVNCTQLAREYGVSRGAISDIKRNKNWRHVQITNDR